MLELTSASVTSTTLVHWGWKTASADNVTTDDASRVMTPPEGRVKGVQSSVDSGIAVVGDCIASQIARTSIARMGRTVGQPSGRLAAGRFNDRNQYNQP